MFTHIMVGTNDVEKARAFYDNSLGALGVANAAQGERLFYMHGGGAFGVGKPFDGGEACFANGGTVGFQAQSAEQVDAFHAAGIANGGSDEGAPGLRPNAPGKAYGAYLRDPDGNKICAFCQLQD
ncbi:VOC family protein [Sphingorhabdus sp. Alg239-R122]|uniref:VOC family protein n=1 Tax=Sphingorhabdus sp. Alg239-R122 TaxID=2305989 RepID=UPI0013DB13F9|nr:VOC family protein [Sphingorhabdus sp. Alg239-R122]